MSKVRYLSLRGKSYTFYFVHIPGSETISVSSNKHSWLGVIGIAGDRENQAWGYPLPGLNLKVSDWSLLISEAKELFGAYGGFNNFKKLELIVPEDATG